MKLSQFKFKLPEEKIALYPTTYRDESRLMVIHKSTGEIEHKLFKDILDYFDDKDVFIFNDTKVFPKRKQYFLYGNYAGFMSCISGRLHHTGKKNVTAFMKTNNIIGSVRKDE